MAGSTGLSVSDIVNVTINLAPLAAQFRNFGLLMILGSSSVIDENELIRQYSTLDEVIADFGTSAPEYLAADLFFSQSPQPAILLIGRWAQTDVPGELHGAVLTPAQQLMSVFTPITSGNFYIEIDGVPLSVTGLNFSGAVNINGVAFIIQTALQALDSGVLCVWNANLKRFDIISSTVGPTSTVNYGESPTATGHIIFTTNPVAATTLTLGGTAITFVASGAVGNQVNIGASTAATLANLLTFLTSSADVNIVKFEPFVVGLELYLAAATPGIAGNALTIATTVAGTTLSGGTLSGATGTDVSTTLGLTQASGASPPVVGLLAESLVNCVAKMANFSNQWYGLTVATSPMPVDADTLAVAALIEGLGLSHVYGVTTQITSALDPANTNDIASQLKSFGYKRTFIQYSSSSPYAVASMYGRAFTVNFEANNTTITLKFKQEPGVQAENLTENQAAALKAKNCNAFVKYNNNTAIIQEGVMVNGYFFDEVHGTDWLQNAIQTDLYNVLHQSPTKIPQTDPGIHVLTTTVEKTMTRSVNNGLVAPGVWNVAGFGQLAQGDTLSKGYYVFAAPVALQAQADREVRKSPPIQVAAKLAGAVHSVNVMVTVNR